MNCSVFGNLPFSVFLAKQTEYKTGAFSPFVISILNLNEVCFSSNVRMSVSILPPTPTLLSDFEAPFSLDQTPQENQLSPSTLADTLTVPPYVRAFHDAVITSNASVSISSEINTPVSAPSSVRPSL